MSAAFRLPTLEPIACACCGQPYTVRREGAQLVARCPVGTPWGGVPTAATRPIPPGAGTHRELRPHVARIPGHCKGCRVELAPPDRPQGGRPREWCETCLPPSSRKTRNAYARKIAARAEVGA